MPYQSTSLTIPPSILNLWAHYPSIGPSSIRAYYPSIHLPLPSNPSIFRFMNPSSIRPSSFTSARSFYSSSSIISLFICLFSPSPLSTLLSQLCITFLSSSLLVHPSSFPPSSFTGSLSASINVNQLTIFPFIFLLLASHNPSHSISSLPSSSILLYLHPSNPTISLFPYPIPIHPSSLPFCLSFSIISLSLHPASSRACLLFLPPSVLYTR